MSAAPGLLKIDQWDLHLEDAAPRNVRFGLDNNSVVYRRFGSEQGLEPLAIPRDFLGLKPESVELLEDFRLFHNLYYDHSASTFSRISASGADEIVAREVSGRLEVRRKHLRQYLAMRDMALFVFCDALAVQHGGWDRVEEGERRVFVARESYVFSVSMGRDSNGDVVSSFRGKCAIWPVPKEDADCWPYEREDQRDERFIVDSDADEKLIELPCSPGRPNTPARLKDWEYLTPVFFRREVLQKYYSDPSRFSVEDGYLRCGARWGLRMDNQSPDYVMVYLGDLGAEVPKEERPYWRSFNVPPEGRKISGVSFLRNVAGIAAESSNPEFALKRVLALATNAWQSAKGWPLYLPHHEADAGNLPALRIPVTDSLLEFDQQVLLLAKVLVDGLNESAIVQHSIQRPPNDAKGIAKLENYLKEQNVDTESITAVIEFLQGLQALRSSGAAHRKGGQFKKALGRLDLDIGQPKLAFANLLQQAIRTMECLREIANRSGA